MGTGLEVESNEGALKPVKLKSNEGVLEPEIVGARIT